MLLEDPAVTIDYVSADVLRVSTTPPIGAIDRRFVGRGAFTDALSFACKAAAGLGYQLIDRTGRLSRDECSNMAAVVAGHVGATIVPLAARG
ncbi:MAG: hypothetical protein NXH88_04590 [Hyphomonas sp.]|nr:hypothetical protein [Hyphomonas sp.]